MRERLRVLDEDGAFVWPRPESGLRRPALEESEERGFLPGDERTRDGDRLQLDATVDSAAGPGGDRAREGGELEVGC